MHSLMKDTILRFLPFVMLLLYRRLELRVCLYMRLYTSDTSLSSLARYALGSLSAA